MSAVANTARGFITEVYKEEIGAFDNEMASDDNLQEIAEEDAEEEDIKKRPKSRQD